MGLIGDLAKATFWGAMLILALATVYFWFITKPPDILAGIVTTGFIVGFGFLAYKMS